MLVNNVLEKLFQSLSGKAKDIVRSLAEFFKATDKVGGSLLILQNYGQAGRLSYPRVGWASRPTSLIIEYKLIVKGKRNFKYLQKLPTRSFIPAYKAGYSGSFRKEYDSMK